MYNQYNQIEAILSQYEMEIYELTKGRGTYICHTNKGLRLLSEFHGTKEKGEFLKRYLEKLKEAGFSVEQVEANQNGEAVTIDEGTGEHFLLKEYILGTELNVNQLKDVKEAAALLGEYHDIASRIEVEGAENYAASGEDVVSEKERHLKEFIKVKNYIRGRKKKNEFERIYLAHYEPMLKTAEKSIKILDNIKMAQSYNCINHGDFNQHNVVCSDKKWQIINFENFVYRWSVLDLANFLRKMQEKNDWDIDVGIEIIESYCSVRSIGTEEYKRLYALLLFPEKFWKVTNHYMSARKTWISERDIDKLKKVIEQEEKRLKFMENLISLFKIKEE